MTTPSVDTTAARELDLYAENTFELYGQFQSIIANLKRRIANGTYSAELAPKLWRYWYDRAAQLYGREYFRNPREHGKVFTPAVRQYCAEQRASDEYQKIRNGEYDA